MVKNKKIKIIITVILVLLVSLVLFVILKKKNTEKVENISPFPDLSIPSFIENKYNVSFTIKENDVNLPQELPYLEKTQLFSLTKNEASLIASSLGFISDPLDVTDAISGEILIWNSETNFLSVTLKERKIKYGPNYNPTEKISSVADKQYSEEEMIDNATKFLKEKLSSFITNPSFVSFTYLKPEEGLELFQETDKTNAQVYQLNFSEGNILYPILTLNPQSTNIYVQLLKDGTILNMESTFISETVESTEKFSTKTFEEIVSQALNAEIVSINNGNENLSDVNPSDIKNVFIDNIFVSYFLENQSDEYFQPIYVLKGNVEIIGYSEQLPIVLYLPAFK